MKRRSVLVLPAVAASFMVFAQAGKETINILKFGARGDGAFNNADAFDAAIKAADGKILFVPAGIYVIERSIVIPVACTLLGELGTKLMFVQPKSDCMVLERAGIEIRQMEIDGFKSSKKSESTAILVKGSDCVLASLIIDNSKTFGIRLLGANNSITSCKVTNSDGTGVALIGATRCSIENVEFAGNRGFGVQVTAGASFNVIKGCKTEQSGLELIGITYDAHHNSVVNNSAENCGDNGISVTGYMNYVAGNSCRKNAYNGIGIWGERNLVVRNSCSENGQKPSPTEFSEIGITPGFGGLGRYNLVVDNICETSSVSARTFNLKIAKGWYLPWQAHIPLSYKQLYYYNDRSIYRLMTTIRPGLTSGQSAPVHTDGVVSDGNADWRWIGSTTSSFDHKGEVWPRSLASVVSEMKAFSVMQSDIAALQKIAEFRSFALASLNNEEPFTAPKSAAAQFDARANFLFRNTGSSTPNIKLRNLSSAGNRT